MLLDLADNNYFPLLGPLPALYGTLSLSSLAYAPAPNKAERSATPILIMQTFPCMGPTKTMTQWCKCKANTKKSQYIQCSLRHYNCIGLNTNFKHASTYTLWQHVSLFFFLKICPIKWLVDEGQTHWFHSNWRTAWQKGNTVRWWCSTEEICSEQAWRRRDSTSRVYFNKVQSFLFNCCC